MSSHRWDVAVVWFRRDLRLADHPALAAAASHAREVVPLFVLDADMLATSAPRAWFLQRSMASLGDALQALGSGLLVRAGRAEVVVPQIARELGASVVLATRDVSPLSHRRDAAVSAALERQGCRLALRPGLLLTEPESVYSGAGRPYSVFTPFWRALRQAPRRPMLPPPERLATPPAMLASSISLRADPAPLPGLPEPGEAAAHERLRRWVTGGLGRYGTEREDLGGEGSSRLGADLHFGTLSPTQVEMAAEETGNAAEPFVRQLAWREFYHHQLYHERRDTDRPDHPLLAAFRREADDPVAVAAWREGWTGIPVVDAAARQLVATGWMSNRARMVSASFLTRHLLMDYRIGERHFLRHLIDGDVANNRGGWRWTAGVGADAQPWFRIFNPVRQGQRFDPDGVFVRRWLPELESVPDRYVHAPWDSPEPVPGYPAPIIGLAQGRDRALAAFRSATAGA